MELKSLLQNSGWEESEVDIPLESLRDRGVDSVGENIKTLVVGNYKALVLNLVFFSITIYVYFQNPTISFLIPTLLIGSCFLFLILSVWGGIIQHRKVDRSEAVAVLIADVLAVNKEMYQRQCKYHSVLITQCFLGGFLLGLAFQGWTLEKYLEKPEVFIFLIPLTIGFFYLTRTKSFLSIHRTLSPNYFRAKGFLENQLAMLQE